MKLLYPCKTMNITQSYLGNYSHEPNRNGSPFDYPIDEAGADRGRDPFFAPCDLKVERVYGVGTSGTNTIWLESTEEVEMPYGKDFVTIMVIHPEDEDLRKLKVGQMFKQGQQIFREGKDGRASGNHFHMSVAAGKIKSTGWVKNSRDAWVIFTTGRPLRPEEAFYLPPGIKIIRTGSLFFKKLPEDKEVKTEKIKVLINGKQAEMETINHNGNNYIKIRDIADADKNDAFTVAWDEKTKTVIIKSN